MRLVGIVGSERLLNIGEVGSDTASCARTQSMLVGLGKARVPASFVGDVGLARGGA